MHKLKQNWLFLQLWNLVSNKVLILDIRQWNHRIFYKLMNLVIPNLELKLNKVDRSQSVSWNKISWIIYKQSRTRLLLTSARISFSPPFNEHALPRTCMRSLHRPCLGTLTVHGVGSALPSLVKTTIVIELADGDWRGNERYMKGSKVTETLRHTGQTKVDLYWPCQVFIIQKDKIVI